eukprot:15881217-Heterocapsa_arctica.AAC.1
MVGDFAAMTGQSSSPHVRACLLTLNKLGAVYETPNLLTGERLDPMQVIDIIWPTMLTARTLQQPGSPEERADAAWKEATVFAEAEG